MPQPRLPEPSPSDLRVIDTEGAPLLREVAVFDGRGRLMPVGRIGRKPSSEPVRPTEPQQAKAPNHHLQ
jgi:hypothetical protein